MQGLGLLLILTVNSVLVASNTPYEELPGIISNEVERLKTGKISHFLTKTVSQASKIKDKKVFTDIYCQTCELVMTQVISYRNSGAHRDSMVNFFQKLCNVFSDWGTVACTGYINIEIDTILFILDNKRDLEASRICGIYFQSMGCTDPNANNWVVPLPPKNRHHHYKPHHHNAATPLKILHLTDFHYDPLYTPGSNAVCDVPLCCQAENGKPTNASRAAGQWGDYHVCDTPWHSITNFTAYLANSTEKFDFVYYTGDIISHKSWATDKDGNTKAIKQLFQHFNETFKKTPVYPILGNHEPHPTDFWSYASGNVNITPSISTQWVFDLMASEWARWLPNDTITTIQKGGYYTVLVRPKNLRIIALNSNVCFISNLWLIYEDEDPYKQLEWLVKTLTEAEKNNETVHILSHIPPGEFLCLQQWSNQFRAIVERFAPIIAAQFNGHTHLDELRLFRDLNNTKKVISVAFNAGSFTTFVGFNPNYRTYDVDSDNFRVLDYDHYTYNLTKANLNPEKPPEWYKLYSFKDAYGLKNITNESLEDLLVRLPKNKTLAHQYWRFQGRDSPVFLEGGCDDLCLAKAVCTITAVETVEAMQCKQLKRKKHHKV